MVGFRVNSKRILPFWSFAIALLLTTPLLNAQNIAFKPLRYDEDYGRLKDDTSSSIYKKLKYMPTGLGGSYLSLGGEVRYQYFHYKNPGWGKQPHDGDGFILSRFLNHADFRIHDRFRLFVQLQSSTVAGSTGLPSPIEDNPLDLHQLFFDLVFFNSQKSKILFRAGRQELSYGSQRLVSVRELPNNRQAFDAFKLILSQKKFRGDVFYSSYVNAKRGIFDEPFWDKSSRFWGSYLAFDQNGLTPNVDLYYFGLKRLRAIFDDGSGREVRHSFGSRLWKQVGQFEYDLEGIYQSGTLAGQRIKAWTISLNTFYQLNEVFLKPTGGIKAELVSGDQQSDDLQINTFNPLFPRGAYFGLASLIGPYNLQDLHPYVLFRMTDKLTWSADYDLFWRMSRRDGLYAVNGRLLQSGRRIPGKYIGSQLGTDLSWQANKFFYLRAELSWFNSGTFLDQAGLDRHIIMTGITATLRY